MTLLTELVTSPRSRLTQTVRAEASRRLTNHRWTFWHSDAKWLSPCHIHHVESGVGNAINAPSSVLTMISRFQPDFTGARD